MTTKEFKKGTFLIALSLLFIFFSLSSKAQHKIWHLSSDTLKYPVKSGEGESSMGWINRYDTFSCKIKLVGSNEIKSAYKVVFMYNGYRIDDELTFNLFLDENRNRIKNVFSYSFYH